MTEYRTPKEDRDQLKHEARVRAVLDQAVRDGASLMAAMDLDEPPQVVERWINAVWNGLRKSLSDNHPGQAGARQEDRLMAIVVLLSERMSDEADAIMRGLRDGDPDV